MKKHICFVRHLLFFLAYFYYNFKFSFVVMLDFIFDAHILIIPTVTSDTLSTASNPVFCGVMGPEMVT